MVNRKIILVALLFALFLSFGCTAPQGRNVMIWGWDSLVGLTLAIVVLLLSLGYMAAAFLGDEKLKVWVKHEVGQVFLSAIIIIFTFALVGSMDYWLKAVSLAGEPGWQSYVNMGVCCNQQTGCIGGAAENRGRACHIEIASDYLQILYESARMSSLSFLDSYSTYALLGHISTEVTLTALVSLAQYTCRPFAGLVMSAEYYSLLFDLAAKTMMLVRAQQIFIDFMWFPLFPVLISMGLILRVLYFTRKLGGLLIALSLSMYIVFPMFYVLSNAILWGFMGGWTTSWIPFGNTFDSQQGADPMQQNQDLGVHAKYVFDPGKIADVNPCDSSTDQEKLEMKGLISDFKSEWTAIKHTTWLEDIVDFMEGGVGTVALGESSAFGVRGPIGTLATIMVFTIFTPFLALMTSLASFKVLSPLLGGDVEISFLSKLI